MLLVQKAPPEEEFGNDEEACHSIDDIEISLHNDKVPFELNADLSPQELKGKKKGEIVELVKVEES